MHPDEVNEGFIKTEQTYVWNLHNGPSGKLTIQFSQNDLLKMNTELSKQMGKIMAIYYLNGYTNPYLHGQNLLVGVPLDPKLPAKFAIRDLSDHAPLPFTVNGKRTSELGIMLGKNLFRSEPRRNGQSASTIYLFKKTDYDKLIIEGFRHIENHLISQLDPSQPPLAPNTEDWQSFYYILQDKNLQDNLPNMKPFVERVRAYKAPETLLMPQRPALPLNRSCSPSKCTPRAY